MCDETRGTKKDFTCPQGLLLEKMVYFRDITLGQQLDDVDISVHCDVKIFDWLMCWTKHSDPAERPSLESASVISILVSASFLKINDLVDECLEFVYRNMNQILSVTPSFSCVGDSLLTRLARLYKPSEIENLSDRRDRIHNRLYTRVGTRPPTTPVKLKEPTTNSQKVTTKTDAKPKKTKQITNNFLHNPNSTHPI